MMSSPADADHIVLANGDLLHVTIVQEGATQLLVQHDVLGTLALDPGMVSEVVRAAAEEAAPPEATTTVAWNREVEAGYLFSRGNTDDESLTGRLTVNRKTSADEWTMKADANYGASNRRMDTQRYMGMLRYAFSVGPRLAWYNFYALQADHDRFANIDWRVTPSTGLGYWFADREDWQAMTEVGLGWERTEFRDATADRNDFVVIPRAFAKKRLFRDTTLSHDLIVWPNLGDVGEYRLRAETVLTNPLDRGLALRLSFVDEFQSDPAEGARRNDARLISSLVWTF